MTAEGLPLRDLLDSAPDGFVVVDAAGIIVLANRTTGQLFGYALDELLGRPVEMLVPERLHSVHHAHRAAFVADPRGRPMGLGLDLVGRRKDGSEFPLEISLSPLHTPGGTVFTAVVRDISERKRLDEERRVLANELETERERDRIAMDLHDGIMQDIYAATLSLELALDESERNAPVIERVIDQLHDVVRNIRSTIFELRPREFGGNLVEAVTNLTNEFGQNSQIGTALDVRGDAPVGLETALAVYNITHESLSNIQRHARAHQVSITLELSDGSGRLEVVDDGVGFDPTADRSQSHRGLRNMHARARSVGAELELQSAPGKGTRLQVRFPTAG